ncbi:MAG: XdhC family protein, partial [Acidobacteriaceae bacterium]
VIDILLEPGTLPETNAMLQALEAAQHGETLYTATVLPSSASESIPFARVIVRPDDSIVFSSSHLSAETRSQLASLARMGRHADTVSIDLGNATQNVFFEPILPPQRLVIFGAGEDARPLARMAYLLGWSIAVADGRPRLAQATRFPEAEQVLVLNEAAANLEQLRLSNRDAVAVLTHSFQQDKNLIRRLLPLELRYLGLLGAHHRSRVLLTEVGQQLGWTPEQCLRRVHTPIGLDLGSDSPETVALAIIAEIQSVIHGKHAAPRHMSEEALHAASSRAYIPVQCPLDDSPPPPYVSKTTH